MLQGIKPVIFKQVQSDRWNNLRCSGKATLGVSGVLGLQSLLGFGTVGHQAGLGGGVTTEQEDGVAVL